MSTLLRHLDTVRTHGHCTNTATDEFYEDRPRAVVELCRTCAVQAECLEFALITDERFGVWGGATEKERAQLSKYLGPLTPAEIADFFVTTGQTVIPGDLT